MCFWDKKKKKKLKYVGDIEIIKRKFSREEETLITFEEPENIVLKIIIIDDIRIT